MTRYTDKNREYWDDLASAHPETDFYEVEEFLEGESTLMNIERDELDVSNRSLLHLQCHFGLDTLSWAREGAQVTGVDFSEEAIELANKLADETGIDADFVCCDIYDVPEEIDDEFDVVFTSYGVLPWLSDLQEWGEVIASSLKPGGTFYIVEDHPFAFVFEEEDGELEIEWRYFEDDEPIEVEIEGSYADRDADIEHTVYEFPHSLSEVVNSVVSSGLEIEFIHEFDFMAWKKFESMEKEGDWWRLPEEIRGSLPLTFSLKATKRIE